MAFKKPKAEFLITADNRSRKAFKQVRGDMQQTANAAGTAIKIMAAAGAAVTALSVKMATDFDKSITEVGALLDSVTQGEMAAMKKQVQDIGIEFGQTRQVSTKALFDITSAGFKGAQGMKVLRVAAELAVAGVTNISNTADLVTSALNAYKLEAEDARRVSDIFFATQRAGKTTIQELAQSIGDVLPTAKLMEVSLEEVGGALATLTLSGTGLPKAVTQLNAFFLALLKPTEEMKKMGINALDAQGRMLPLLQVVKQFEGIDPKVLAKLVPNIEAFRGLATLAGSFKSLEANIKGVEDSAGATSKAFKLLSDAGAARIDRVAESFKVLLETIGDVLSESDAFKLLTTEFEILFKDLSKSINDNRDVLTKWVDTLGGEFRRSVRVGLDTVKVFGAGFDLLTAIIAKSTQLVLFSAKGWAFLFDAMGITKGGVEEMSKALEEAGLIAEGAYLEAVETLANLKVSTTEATAATKKQTGILKDYNTTLEDTVKLTEDLGELITVGDTTTSVVSDKNLKARKKVLEQLQQPLKKFREDQANLFSTIPDAFGDVDLKTTVDEAGFEKQVEQQTRLGTATNLVAIAQKNANLAKAAGLKTDIQLRDIPSDTQEKNTKAEERRARVLELLTNPLDQAAKLENDLDDMRRAGTITTLEHADAVERLHQEYGLLDDAVDPTIAALDRIASGLEQNFTEALFDAIQGTGDLKDSLKSMVDLILIEMLRLAVVRPFLGFLGSFLPGFESGGSFTVGRGFAHGGGFTVGGNGGTDQTPVGFMATAGERVTVETPAQQSRPGENGGVKIFMDLRGNKGNREIEEAVQKGISRAAPELIGASVKAVRESRNRNPAFFSE